MTETTITLRHPAGRAVSWKMDLDPGFVSDHHILEYVDRQACYEPEVAWVMMRALGPGHNCVDVGACVGFFTLLMSQLVGPNGQVISCEPASDNRKHLDHNLALNTVGRAAVTTPKQRPDLTPGQRIELDGGWRQPDGFNQDGASHVPCRDRSNVMVIANPLSERFEQVRFYFSEDSSGGHALWDPALWHENIKTQEQRRNPASRHLDIKMDTTTLNRITPDPCRLIKLDTEGAEERILQGGADVLRNQHPPFIVAEMNAFGLDQMGSSPESLRGLMRLHGYDTFALYPDGAYPELVPPKKTVECEHVFNVLFSSPEAVASIWK